MTIAELSTLDADAFVDIVGWAFEHSPWVAQRAWADRPFDSLDALHDRMVAAMQQASRDEQLALLRAHPDLGARMRMSTASIGEQAGAGLDSLSTVEFDVLQSLNSAYREKFGFPFLFAVKGSTSSQILTALRQRLPRDGDTEFAEALHQVARIARFRLEQVITR